MNKPSQSHDLDRSALLLSIAYGDHLYSTEEREEELLDLLISCYKTDEEKCVLEDSEKIKLLQRLVGISYDCQMYPNVIEYVNKLLTLPISLKTKGNAYSYLGRAYDDIGQYLKAIDCHEKHLEISVELVDRDDEMIACCNLGTAHKNIGQFKEALGYHERQLKLSKELGDTETEALAFCRMGITYWKSGQYGKALECQEKYLDMSVEAGDLSSESSAYCNLGLIYDSIGQYKKAKEFHERHLEIAKELGDKASETKAYCNLGLVHNSLREYDVAIDYHEKDLKLSKELGDRLGEKSAYCNLGLAYNNIGQYEKALGYHKSHLEISKEFNDKAGECLAHRNLGVSYHFLRDYDKAIESYKLALGISGELGDKVSEGWALYNLGISYYRLSQYDIQCRYLCQSISVRHELREDFVARDQFNISFANQDFMAHRYLAEGLLCLNFVKKAMLVSDIGRSKALSDLLRLNLTSISGNCFERHSVEWIKEIPSMIGSPEVDSHVEISENVLQSAQDGTVVVFGFSFSGDLLTWVLTQRQTYVQRWQATRMPAYQLIESIVVKIRGGLRAHKSNLSFHDERDTARERIVKQLYQLHEQEGKLNSEGGELPDDVADEKELKEILRNFETLQNDEDNPTQQTEIQMHRFLHAAYKLLIGNVENLLTGSKLIIIPEGPLFRLPFCALLDGERKYLCDRFSIQVTPALHILNFSMSLPEKPLGGALIVGNPTVGEVLLCGERRRLDPLPGAEKEAIECAKFFQAQPLLRHCATKSNVLKRITSASVVHIAAHGNMEYAEIFLAPNYEASSPAEEEQYLLTSDDISKCSLNARLVVLSCCHSGYGDISAEGVVGTARSFLGAGARAVLVALWELPDQKTQQFVKLFYGNVCKGNSVCTALQQAMKDFKESNVCIGDWAAFQIFGEDVFFSKEQLQEICQSNRRCTVNVSKQTFLSDKK